MKSGEIARLRSLLIANIFSFFIEREFVFVDVPSIVSFPGVEVNIDLFEVNGMFLHPSPEIEIKKSIAELDFERAFYMGHVYRKERRDSTHLPEFMMVEWYRKGVDLEVIKKDVILLVSRLYELVIDRGIEPPFNPLSYREFSVRELFMSEYGIELCMEDIESFTEKARKITGIESSYYAADDLFFVLWLPVEEKLKRENQIFFIKDYPSFVSSLAEAMEGCPGVVKRMEFYISPYEIANGYCELHGGESYRRRFDLLNQLRNARGLDEIEVDEDFLKLMNLYPPSAGIALGVDRLLMALLGVGEISDVSYS